MTSSFAPELNYQAGKPTFNGDPGTIFEDGQVPAGWQTMEPETAKQPGAGTGAAKTMTVTNSGSGLTDGSPTGVATTKITGSGSGAKVDLVISSGQVQSAAVSTAGTGYAQDDQVSVAGYADVVLTVGTVG